MRIYVASYYKNERVREVMNELIAAGHTITHDWIGAPGNLQNAMKDMNGVLTADVLVLVADEGCRNSLVELGMALGNGIPVYVLGDALDPQPKDAPTSGIIFLLLPTVGREAQYKADLLEGGLGDEHKRS